MTHKLSSETIDNIIKYGSDEQRQKLFKEHYDNLNSSHLYNLSNRSKDPEVHKEILKHPKVDSDLIALMTLKYRKK